MKTSKKIVSKDTGRDPTFEQAIQRLEKIVAEMESAELPLEDVLKKYEEGSHLVRFCSQKLEEAEKKIELLTRRSDGSVTLKAFPSGDEVKEEESEGGNAEDKEAKLF
jgi:exodeoxyribonuclease VII small subunit